MRTLAKQGFDTQFHVAGWKAVAIALHRHAVQSHQELLKVPGDIVSAPWRSADEVRVSQEPSGHWPQPGLLTEGEELLHLCPICLAAIKDPEAGFKPTPGWNILEKIRDPFVLGVFLMPDRSYGEAKQTQGPDQSATEILSWL